MIVRDTNFVTQLAVIVEDMATDGDGPTDIYIADLLTEYLRRNFPATQLQEHHMEKCNLLVRKVRDELVRDGFDVCLVNGKYFARKAQAEANGNAYPVTEAQARKSIARGSAKAMGLHFFTGNDDLIWRATMLFETRTGAKRYAKNANKVVSAMNDGRLDMPNAGRILRAADRELVIEEPETIRQAIEQAPDDEE